MRFTDSGRGVDRSRLQELADELRSNWQADAACFGMDQSIFFPEKGHSGKQAKAVCSACPVRTDCKEFALKTLQQFGVWGGLTEPERRAEIRRRARAEKTS